MPDALETVRNICLLLLAVVCVYTDLARGKLYNVVTLGGVAAGLTLAYWLDPPGTGFVHLRMALVAAVLGGGLMWVVYLLGGFGAGEVKFMAAVGALAPFHPVHPWIFVLMALVYTALIGAGMGMIVLIWQKSLLQGLKDSARALVRFRAQKPDDGKPPLTIPYGVAIGIGVVWAWMEVLVQR